MLVKNIDELREITIRPFTELKCDICGAKAVPTTANQYLLAGNSVRCKKCWHSTKKAAGDEEKESSAETK